MDMIGQLCELSGELKIEWKIEHLISDKETFKSPPFYFAGASWEFQLYQDPILHLVKLSNRGAFNLDVTVIMTVTGKKGQPENGTYYYDDQRNTNSVAGWPYVILSEDELELPLRCPPSIIFTCTLKNEDPLNITNSPSKRLSVLAEDLQKLHITKEGTDLTLNVKGSKFPVHRLILRARSAKFAVELDKRQTNELKIDHIDPSLMGIILDYIYKGDTDLRVGKNWPKNLQVFSTYIIAKNYKLEGLKEICSDYIRQHLTVGWLFDVLKFADEHKAKEINDFATEFFVANVSEITETDGWKTFSREYKDKSIELLTCSVKKRITYKEADGVY